MYFGEVLLAKTSGTLASICVLEEAFFFCSVGVFVPV